MRLVLMSDTHTLTEGLVVPNGDVLIHAGDCTNNGEAFDLMKFGCFLYDQPHKHKLIIAGNHDFCFEKKLQKSLDLLPKGVVYLQDDSTEIDGVKFWGSPWQPEFFDWAFNLQRGEEIRKKWDLIPEGTDVLITHGPPKGFLDMCKRDGRCGCEELLSALDRVKPKLHVFGHIHEGYGRARRGETDLINASVCNHRYRPINKPVVFDI